MIERAAVSYNGKEASYRRYRLPDLAWAGVLIVATTILFWVMDLDLTVARFFYDAGNSGRAFPEGQREVWKFLSGVVPLLTAGLGVGGVGVLIAGCFWKNFRRRRIHAVFIILSVALGPGLVTNAVFKPHFGRPRPRQTVEFGGELDYLPVLVPGSNEKGRSFAGGDSSVGFAFCVFYFLYRRRRPGFARCWLAFSIMLGLAIGTARIAAGAHFLSDVLWSGYSSYLVALVVYYFGLRVPHREDLLEEAAIRGARPD